MVHIRTRQNGAMCVVCIGAWEALTCSMSYMHRGRGGAEMQCLLHASGRC